MSIHYKGTACLRSSIEEYRQQEESLSAELEQGRQRSEEVNRELGQVLEELGNARLDSQENRRQLRRKELLERLRRLYPESVVRAPAKFIGNKRLQKRLFLVLKDQKNMTKNFLAHGPLLVVHNLFRAIFLCRS